MAGLATDELGNTDDPDKPMTANDIKKMEKMYKCTVSVAPAPPPPPAPCKNNEDDASCDSWADYGYCNDEEYGSFMKNDCAKACKFC